MQRKICDMGAILSLKITLNNTTPFVWRRVLVPTSLHFFDLHHIFQICMGWQRSHLFEFIAGEHTIGYINPAQAFEDLADAKEVTLDLLLLKPGFTFKYLYNFGEYWEHTVEVENILKEEEHSFYPCCVDGQLACLPDDCGGIDAYNRLLKNIHGDLHKESLTGTNLNFGPDKFSVEKVNAELPKFKSYMKDWL